MTTTSGSAASTDKRQDALSYRLSYGFHLADGRAMDKLLNAAQIQPTESVLDLGCGLPVFLIRCAQQTEGRLLGIDLNPYIEDLGGQLARNILSRSDRIELRTGDITNGNFMRQFRPRKDRPGFDVITASLVTHQFDSTLLHQHLSLWGRLLNKNGRLVVGIYHDKYLSSHVFSSAMPTNLNLPALLTAAAIPPIREDFWDIDDPSAWRETEQHINALAEKAKLKVEGKVALTIDNNTAYPSTMVRWRNEFMQQAQARWNGPGEVRDAKNVTWSKAERVGKPIDPLFVAAEAEQVALDMRGRAAWGTTAGCIYVGYAVTLTRPSSEAETE